MNRIFQTILAAALLLAAAPGAAHADDPTTPGPTTTTTVFETVDSVLTYYESLLIVRGVPQGESQTREFRFRLMDAPNLETCHRQAMLAMDRPGRYLLEFSRLSADAFSCRLTRR